jgi:hypothetical protein
MAAAVLRVPYVRVLAGYDPNTRRPRQQVNLSFIENRKEFWNLKSTDELESSGFQGLK